MIEVSDDFRHSSLREGLVEHLFVGAVMRELWLRGQRDIEVLRSVTDAAGYDVVIASGGVMRQIQLKTSGRKARTPSQKINLALTKQPSGCVVWIRLDPETLEIGPFHWFGGLPGSELPPLGDKVGKHNKGDSQGKKLDRPNIRVLAKSRFATVLTIEGLVDYLFGGET